MDYLAPHLARIMEERLELPSGIAELAAVPATSRARRRAPHAADLLARPLAQRMGIPFYALRLEKRRETERQSSLPLERRSENVRGAFRARGRAQRRVLLVDDVATSGATARECTHALRKAGAETVTVSVLCARLEARCSSRTHPGMKALNSLIVRALPLVPTPIVRRIASRYVAGETLGSARTPCAR